MYGYAVQCALAVPPNPSLESKDQEKKLFFDLADQLESAQDPDDRKKIKEMLVRMTFGEHLPLGNSPKLHQ